MAPATLTQLAQLQRPDADTLKIDHLQPHQFAHTANLAIASFRQDEAQPLGLDLGDAGALQLAAA